MCSHANLAHLVSGTEKLLIRENAVMRYFFSLCPFRHVGYFKPKVPRSSRSSTILFLPLPSHPLPTPGTLEVPPLSLFLTPLCCATALLTRGHQAALAHQGGLPPYGEASVLFVVFFSANTRTEREARINSQTDTKQRDRGTAI